MTNDGNRDIAYAQTHDNKQKISFFLFLFLPDDDDVLGKKERKKEKKPVLE